MVPNANLTHKRLNYQAASTLQRLVQLETLNFILSANLILSGILSELQRVVMPLKAIIKIETFNLENG